MKLCQYEFQFQNEYMEMIVQKIGKILEIDINKENMIRKDVDEQSFILLKKDVNNFMLFSAHKSSYVYLVIIRCKKAYEDAVRSILMEICYEIEDDYGEDHKCEVIDVFGNQENWFMKENITLINYLI